MNPVCICIHSIKEAISKVAEILTLIFYNYNSHCYSSTFNHLEAISFCILHTYNLYTCLSSILFEKINFPFQCFFPVLKVPQYYCSLVCLNSPSPPHNHQPNYQTPSRKVIVSLASVISYSYFMILKKHCDRLLMLLISMMTFERISKSDFA